MRLQQFNLKQHVKLSSSLIALIILSISTGCQSLKSITSGSSSENSTTAKSHKELVKAQKRLQSEADLPFRGLDTSAHIQTIAFGSCANQDKPQPIWSTILKQNPDLFLFMGDNVYASRPEQKPLSEQYKKLNRIPEYRAIRERVPFMAIWDDHDYGSNDSGKDNPDKEQTRKEFLKYWSYLNQTLPPNQKALYHSKIFGSKKQTVQVIFLDTRWDRSPLKKISDTAALTTPSLITPNETTANQPTVTTPTVNTESALAVKKIKGEYEADTSPDKHFLSEQQWQWLESELKKPAALKVLVSSIQVIANDHHFEKWGNFPLERERLLNLIQKTKAKNLVILSGDRHAASIAKLDTKKSGTLYDITASALNKEAKEGNELNDSTYLSEAFGEPNFGLLKINWNQKKALIEIRSQQDEVKQSVEVNF